MNGESIFEVSDVSFSNLEALSMSQAKNHEMRICEIAFIAEKIVRSALPYLESGMSVIDILTVISDEYSSYGYNCDAYRSGLNIGSFMSDIKDSDKAVFAELLIEKFGESGVDVSEKDFLRGQESDETFTYVKNSLSDEAYDVFSQEFSDPRVLYSESFKEACFAVADKKVGYCILPFEEKGGVRVPGIYSLISKLDLKIVSVTPVFGFEGTSDMKYALVSGGYSIPERDEDVDRYLEIRLGRECSLDSLLFAARRFDISLYRINTLYTETNDESSSFYSIVLKDGGKSFAPLLVFLNIFIENYSPVGIYKNLE